MKPNNALRWGLFAVVAAVVLGTIFILNFPSGTPKSQSHLQGTKSSPEKGVTPQSSSPNKQIISGIDSPQAQANSIIWRNSLDSALQEAKQTNRPVLVDFNTVWCGPCQIMKKTTFKDANVISESKKWVMVSIDGDKQPKVAAEYKVDGYPTLLILKPDGTIVSRAGGEMGVKALLTWQKSKYQAAQE